MNKLFVTGKIIFCIAIAGIAINQLLHLSFPAGLIGIKEEFPGKIILVVLSALVLLICSLGVLLNKSEAQAAIGLLIMLGLFQLYPHIPRLIMQPKNANAWVAFLEILCLMAGTLVILGIYCENTLVRKISTAAKYIFAFSIIIFGIQHFMYEDFIITLMPGWLPGKIIFSNLVKAAFILTAISIIVNILTRLSLLMLGGMFVIWVIILHTPRALDKMTNEPEWTSFFIAAAMSGICFMLASQQKSPVAKLSDHSVLINREASV